MGLNWYYRFLYHTTKCIPLYLSLFLNKQHVLQTLFDRVILSVYGRVMTSPICPLREVSHISLICPLRKDGVAKTRLERKTWENIFSLGQQFKSLFFDLKLAFYFLPRFKTHVLRIIHTVKVISVLTLQLILNNVATRDKSKPLTFAANLLSF